MCGGGNTGVAPTWLDPVGVSKWGGGALDPAHLFGNPQLDAQKKLQADTQTAEQQRQAGIQKSLDTVNGIFTSPDRQASYDKYGTDTFNLLKNSLDQNQGQASRQLNFGLMRTGNTGGSNDIDQHGLLAKDYYTGLLDASNKSQGAKAQLEGEDRSLQGSIDNLVLGGLSATNATQQATEGAQANAQGAKASVIPATLDQTFGDLASGYLSGKAAAGAQAANGAGAAPGLGSEFALTAPQAANDPMSQWGAQWLDIGGPS